MLKSWKTRGWATKALNLTALTVILVGGGLYAAVVWDYRQHVRSRVYGAEFQNTHFGRTISSYCGEVSGINGFGTRSPYLQFVVTNEDTFIAPPTLNQDRVDEFKRIWLAQCGD
ncbi:hypothetical protein ACJ51O_36045 (plasmid) [Burkholderia pyrrocinia]|uniref:hypothetical protein n=1 Tax=Burkholderia pyrrocinia TaxID=60550 RepID=UPI0038B4AABB